MYPVAVLDFMRQAEQVGLTTTEAENVFMVIEFAGSHNKDGGTGPVSSLEGKRIDFTSFGTFKQYLMIQW